LRLGEQRSLCGYSLLPMERPGDMNRLAVKHECKAAGCGGQNGGSAPHATAPVLRGKPGKARFDLLVLAIPGARRLAAGDSGRQPGRRRLGGVRRAGIAFEQALTRAWASSGEPVAHGGNRLGAPGRIMRREIEFSALGGGKAPHGFDPSWK